MQVIVEHTETGTEIQFPSIIKKYSVIETIGKGSFGIIVRAQEIDNNNDVAMKIVSRSYLERFNCFLSFEQEVRILQSISHPNIIKIHEVIYLEDIICVVMEYCRYNDLLKLVLSFPSLLIKNMRKIMKQIVDAVQYLHDRKISHLDLKPENIFIDQDINVKIGDFGCCHTIHNRDSMQLGTLFYIAPEMLTNPRIDPRPADIWAIGIIFYVMSSGTLPWRNGNDEEMKEQIKHGILFYEGKVPIELEIIIKQCCRIEPEERITASALLESDFFKTPKARQYASISKMQSFSKVKFQSEFVKRRVLIVKPEQAKMASLSTNMKRRSSAIIPNLNHLTDLY